MTGHGEWEYRTIPITPAAMTGWRRHARRRQQELETITGQGWEIVDIAPKRFGSTRDHVTARRRRGTRQPPPRRMSWWEQVKSDLFQPRRQQKLHRRLRG